MGRRPCVRSGSRPAGGASRQIASACWASRRGHMSPSAQQRRATKRVDRTSSVRSTGSGGIGTCLPMHHRSLWQPPETTSSLIMGQFLALRGVVCRWAVSGVTPLRTRRTWLRAPFPGLPSDGWIDCLPGRRSGRGVRPRCGAVREEDRPCRSRAVHCKPPKDRRSRSPATSTSTRLRQRQGHPVLEQHGAVTPGARTAWHTHPLGQTIYVTEGVGRCQRRGGPIEEIRSGRSRLL